MCEDLRSVVDIPSEIWERLVEVVPCRDGLVADLRSRAVWSSLATMAYVYKDSFEQLRSLPLSLTQGDLRANLLSLAEVGFETLHDDFSNNLRLCMESGGRSVDT